LFLKSVMSDTNPNAVAEVDPPEKSSGVSSWIAGPPNSEIGNEKLPEWYREFQQRAWRDFLDLPDPHRKHENWRFANLKLSKMAGLQAGDPSKSPDKALVAELLERSEGSKGPAARFVFFNNSLIAADTANLPEGTMALSIRDALEQHGELLRDHFMRDEAGLGGEKFAALHGAADLSGVFLKLPKGVVLESPIEIFHWAAGPSTVVFPHTLIVADENSSASVVDYFASANDEDETLAIAVSDLDLDRNAEVQYTAVQEWNPRSRHFQLNSTRVGRDANASRCVVNLGASWSRDESTSRLIAPGGNSDMLAVNLATGDEEYDLRTLQLHEAEHTTSDLVYKNALYDRARTIFSGLIKVGENAHFTDAFQTCRNLLGSDEAEANAMPGLEINADQVKCSHGSTSGQISDEEVFYLRARGIDPEEARRMITFGFLNEVVGKISREGLRERLTEKLRRKFNSLAK
jgi:Fe-S cluster assembly protein SufD